MKFLRDNCVSANIAYIRHSHANIVIKGLRCKLIQALSAAGRLAQIVSGIKRCDIRDDSDKFTFILFVANAPNLRKDVCALGLIK